MPPAPPRRFAPTPTETTSRSSQQDEQPIPDEHGSKRRRFVPEPVESHSYSTTDRPNTPEIGDLQILKHEHKVRRFAPQPVESTTRSSKGKSSDGDKENRPQPRRFAPEPVETTRKSSKDKVTEEKPHIRFKPELLETTYSSVSARKQENGHVVASKTTRKFAPVLLDTAKRSRKAGDAKPLVDTAHKTEHGFGLAAREHRRHITGVATPMELDEPDQKHSLDLTAVNEQAALRSIAPFDGSSRRAQSQQRQHSFRCPDLDTIESSESEQESDTSSTPDVAQGSPITASDSSFNEFKHATRARESIDENFSNYFLQLEAKRAEKRMREQALAAFPNSDFHEPVQHYVDVEKDSDSDESIDYRPTTYGPDEDDIVVSHVVRRDSTKVPWEQLEMQQHAEKLDQERKANQLTAKSPSINPWWNPAYEVAQPDQEMRSMRDRARPPMLGGDISFPRCQSPEPTRFDVTQGAAALKNQMSAERNATKSKTSVDGPSLWTALTPAPTNTSTSSSSSSGPGGLWGGFCTESAKKNATGLEVPKLPSGLVTPRSESMNVFDQSFSFPHSVEMRSIAIQTPPTPTDMPPHHHHPGSHTINNILNTHHDLEQAIERDFPDSFVTQVYNYLSLGYPSLARPFDAELCKISHISFVDLRADDDKARASPRGYIRLGPDFEGGGGVDREDNCMRWVALKRYIHEWARQEQNMSKQDGAGGMWATTARRGSWGN